MSDPEAKLLLAHRELVAAFDGRTDAHAEGVRRALRAFELAIYQRRVYYMDDGAPDQALDQLSLSHGR